MARERPINRTFLCKRLDRDNYKDNIPYCFYIDIHAPPVPSSYNNIFRALTRTRTRALRKFFPEKPFNPALIRITACNQTGCECIVCTSNPSLMMGCVLSCLVLKLVGYFLAKLTALPTNLFFYALAGKPVSSITISKIVFIISKIIFPLI